MEDQARPVIVVLEGPDGSGKSTLAKKLSESLGVPLRHLGAAPTTDEEYYRRFGDFITLTESTVVDRSPAVSELVYGLVLGKGTFTPPFNLLAAIVAKSINDPFYVYIYCRPFDDVLEENLKTFREDKPHKPSDHCRNVKSRYWSIVHAYDFLMPIIADRFPLKSYYWSPLCSNYDEILHFVGTFLGIGCLYRAVVEDVDGTRNKVCLCSSSASYKRNWGCLNCKEYKNKL